MSAARTSRVEDSGVPAAPLSVADLERLYLALPATQRAAIAWAPGELRAAIKTLREIGDPTKEQIAVATEAIFRLVEPIIEPIMKSLGESHGPGLPSAQVSTLWKTELDRLRSFLPDAASVHAAEWLLRAYDTTVRAIASALDAGEWEKAMSELKGRKVPSGAFLEDSASILRVQSLLMAAIAEAEERGSPEKASELLDRAFLEMIQLQDLLAQGNVTADPFEGEAPSERGNRLLAYVDDVRGSLTSFDLDQIVRAGRIGPLR